MLGHGWLTIRQAQEALRNGQIDGAHSLLRQPGVRGHKRSWELFQQLGQAFIDRAERGLRQDDPESAWSDLLRAEEVGLKEEPGAKKLRQALARLGMAEVRALVEAGEPGRGAEAIAQLREKGVRQPELHLLDEACKEWVQARDLAERGEFNMAQQAAERLHRLQPIQGVKKFLGELTQRRETCSNGLMELHKAVDENNWRMVIELADQVLAVAPQQKEARKARQRAWKAVEPTTVGLPGRKEETKPPPPANRFLLWIDGVGGFLVCLNPRVTVGQGMADAPVDIPLIADLSRHHAALTRDTEGYVLEASKAVKVNHRPTEKTLLRSGDRLTLGTSCQLQFWQPVPISASARLDVVSGHRLPLAVDGVLLMAETLIMGPGKQAHVAMPDLDQTIVLFRQKEGIGVRYGGKFTIDGEPCQERGTLAPTSRVVGEHFVFAVEPVGARIGR